MYYPLDCEGNKIVIGDHVIYIHVTESLLKGLPREDQEAIIAQEGKIFKVIDFNEFGKAELEFEYKHADLENVTYHTIWVEPICLKKVQNIA